MCGFRNEVVVDTLDQIRFYGGKKRKLHEWIAADNLDRTVKRRKVDRDCPFVELLEEVRLVVGRTAQLETFLADSAPQRGARDPIDNACVHPFK